MEFLKIFLGLWICAFHLCKNCYGQVLGGNPFFNDQWHQHQQLQPRTFNNNDIDQFTIHPSFGSGQLGWTRNQNFPLSNHYGNADGNIIPFTYGGPPNYVQPPYQSQYPPFGSFLNQYQQGPLYGGQPNPGYNYYNNQIPHPSATQGGYTQQPTTEPRNFRPENQQKLSDKTANNKFPEEFKKDSLTNAKASPVSSHRDSTSNPNSSAKNTTTPDNRLGSLDVRINLSTKEEK